MLAVSYAEVRRPGIGRGEERVFRWANEADDRLRAPVRAVMQAGTFVTVPLVAAVVFVAGRRALAARVLLAGTAAWLGAKAIKPYGGRERPYGVLGDGVHLREGIEGDLGWVSGHTAVATTLALVLSDDLPAWTVPVLAAVVATTGYGRMYVGAHLPQDVVGGAGLGLLIAGLAPGGGR
jgi:glycosyltransferase 2 family protein